MIAKYEVIQDDDESIESSTLYKAANAVYEGKVPKAFQPFSVLTSSERFTGTVYLFSCSTVGRFGFTGDVPGGPGGPSYFYEAATTGEFTLRRA